MNEFLDNLENRISILEEIERKKVLKKYQKDIEKKIKDGMDEKTAIDSLGSIDEIVENVYAEYHINNNYKEEKKTLGKMIDEGISICAKYLSEFCKELIDYAKKNTSDKPLETFFEVILKVLLLIMGFMIIKLPFILVEEIFVWIFDLLFSPFDIVLIILLKFILAVIYLICCIVLGIYMFKNYYKKEEVVKYKKEEQKNEKTEKAEETKEKEENKEIVNYAFAFIKVFLYIIVIIPMIFINLALFVLALFAAFLVFKGVNIIGLTILLIGLFLLTTVITNYITDALDNKYKNHLFSLSISVIVIIIGGILFVDNLFSFNYPTNLEESRFTITNETKIIEIEKETSFRISDGNIEYIIDNNLSDNKILLEVNYYDEFTDVYIENYDGKNNNYILIYPINDKFTVKSGIYFYENALKDLKNDDIYDYQDLRKIKVIVFCSEKTRELLK